MIDAAEISESKNTLTISEAMARTGDLTDKVLNNAPAMIRDMTAHLAQVRGKGVRTLLLLTCAADNEGLVPDIAVNCAAAIELFHLATLVHDDIIDDAALRRGIPTLHNKFGYKDAVMCGDYLLCLAMSTLSPALTSSRFGENAKLFPMFTNALGRTCLGELDEYRNNRNLDLSVVRYLRIISGKTASLFYVSAYAGAVSGNLSAKETRLLSKFGRGLGMIFQITDDCKDFEFSEQKAQKPVCNDIIEGVVTLPLIFAMQKDKDLARLAKDAFQTAEAARLLHKKVETVGGLEQSRQLAQKYCRKALKLLDKLESEQKRKTLTELLQRAFNAAVSFV